jgi:uncharacterized protein YaaQ
MKLIIAVVQDKDAGKLIRNLMEKNYRVTKLASTGGFLKVGNTTLLIGAEDDKVNEVIDIIKEKCRAREQIVTPVSTVGGPVDSFIPYPVEVVVGGATVFVIDVEQFQKL